MHRTGNTHLVELLLDKGASINSGNNTPLHLAAWKGHTVVVVALLDKGASANTTNRKWSYAIASSRTESSYLGGGPTSQ